jgi:hypothetical protein
MKFLYFLLPVALIFASHYVAANLYASICAPLSLKGLLLSFVTTSSPVCTALLGVLNFTSNTYASILAGFLTTAVATLTRFAAPAPTPAPAAPAPSSRRQREPAGASPVPA